jgi:GTPase
MSRGRAGPGPLACPAPPRDVRRRSRHPRHSGPRRAGRPELPAREVRAARRPDGGDGGPGGSVYLVANANLNTLVNYRFQKIFEAGRGGHGEGSNRTGKTGASVELEVPIGTTSTSARRTARACRWPTSPRTASACWSRRGASAATGNASFVTPPTARPARRSPGLPGEEKDLRLHLKLLADVGLVGFPNAGKSTLIARISAARPKIADYPFTTLVPNLGVVGLSGDRSFVVADVPGLIEGAHTGTGLGHRFLSHLERTKVLVHLVDVSSFSGRDPVHDFDVIMRELDLFPGRDATGERLVEKPMIVAANKMDALDEPERLAGLEAHVREQELPFFAVSAATGSGVDALLDAVWRKVAEARAHAAAAPSIDDSVE